MPLISVTATIPTATEAGPTTGLVTLLRLGDISTAFVVTVGITGTAIAGVNYVSLPTAVQFNAGDVMQQLTIIPIVGGLGAATSATVIVTAVPDTGSGYYAATSNTPIGPLSSTDYTVVWLNQDTVTITH